MEYKKINMPGLLHGGDYNPEQWLDRPDILEEDIRLMKLAHVNNVSLGIFSWAFLEPEEGKYQFDYLEEIINRLYDNGIYTNLATPTGAMPNWMTQKYPEVMQTDENGIQNLPGKRHNFCYTSAVMREKTRKLREIRSIIRISTEKMASATGISQERLQQIEAGEKATITELREIAMQLRTSTHVITNQYFFEPQFSEMEYYMDMKDALDEISGFWGHVGIKLCGIDKYMWYPINSNTRKMIYKGIDEELMVIPCMNNKVLFLNMSNIEDITLSDFDADTPSGKNWDEHVSCGEIPLVVYEALEDYEENSQVTLYNDTENSTELYRYLMEYVRKNGWTEEDIFQLLNTSVFYYLDGRKKSTIIDFYQDSDDIIETIEMVYGYDFTDIEQNFMFYIDAHDETENFVNLKGISMMELPLLKVEEEIFRRNDQ